MLWYSFTLCRTVGYINGGGLSLWPLASFTAPALTSAGACSLPLYPWFSPGYINREKSRSRASLAVPRFIQATATTGFLGVPGHSLFLAQRFQPGPRLEA